MFEFLFRRPGDKPGETSAGQANQAGEQAGSPSAPASAPAASAAARTQQAEQLARLGGDEQAAADFILQCDFSDLRLQAAELVHSPALLERVHTAIRNTDRRVAKLMSGRLDAWRHHEAEVQRAEAAIAQAESLAADDKLTPNQVADLDRKWAVIRAPQLSERFDAVRARLAGRLEAQVALQRAMIDRLNTLRQLAQQGLSAAELRERMAQLQQEQDAALAAPEHASLPRSLVNEFANEYVRLQDAAETLERGREAIVARETALEEWRAGLAPDRPLAFNAEQLKRAWGLLPPAPQPAGADLQQRFEALLARLPQPEARPPREPRKVVPPDQHVVDAIEAMEKALEQGSLHSAAEHDKIIKDHKNVRLTAALSDRLAHARAELKRLSDWARWGGNVSREELIKAVEQLTTQQMTMGELAKKVGSMRDRWKALDTLSGAAPKSLWERFDAACTTAYAPAAAHFKHLADERHTNAAKAQALVEEARAEAQRLAAGTTDWKHMAAAVQRVRLAWSHLGAIDRKEKKRLDHEFTDVLNTLQAPLEEQRKGEVRERETLIAEVAALNPHDRHTLDRLRSIQERWQQHARALPLERKSEQALWQRFRAACDAVFAARKEQAHAADTERRAHQHVKEAICARLEQGAGELDAQQAQALLRETALEWQAIGEVPRAVEARLDKRYQAAQAGLHQRIEQLRRQAGLAQAGALRDKLRLCQELEAALADPGGDPAGADWSGRWAALPALSSEYEKALRQRFDAGLSALASNRAAYAARLEQNRARLLDDVLRLEIAVGIDSGSEFARERLKLQVESLQSSLKSGQKQGSAAGGFLALIGTPALLDARTATRIEHLFTRLHRDGK